MTQMARNVLAPLTLRFGLAFFFAVQGLSKLGPDNGWGSAWHEEVPAAAQVAIAWGELGGAALLVFGFLTRIFALLLGGILVAALLAVHGAGEFNLRSETIAFDYNAAVLAACLTLALLGGGPVGLDTWFWEKKK